MIKNDQGSCGLKVEGSNVKSAAPDFQLSNLRLHYFALPVMLLLPAFAIASPSSALREYKDGKYEQALKEYEQLLEKKNDDPRLHFNAGASAYRSRQFDEAIKQFDQALNSPDLKLQELGYYNRGNSLYYLGEHNPDPNQRTGAWEKALKDYDLSLKLNPQDADAKFNQAFVKKKLEELKQQQQQQNQQNKDQKNQDQQQQQQQEQQNQQSKQDQNQQQQSQQNQQQQQQQQKQDSSQQNQQAQKQEDQKQQQAAKQSQDQQQKQQPQQAQQSSAQKPEPSQQNSNEMAQAYAAGQMTPEQARQLLDAQKGEEKMLPIKPEGKPVDRSKPFKDW
jgi:Ca-activated chloride channel family protein